MSGEKCPVCGLPPIEACRRWAEANPLTTEAFRSGASNAEINAAWRRDRRSAAPSEPGEQR